MRVGDTPVTARIHRTESGEIGHEYVAGNVTYSSVEALREAVIGDRQAGSF